MSSQSHPPLSSRDRSSAALHAGRVGKTVKRTLRAEEFAGDVEGLAADDDDLLAVEELLGDDAGEATEEVALAVDDDLANSNISNRLFQSQCPKSIAASRIPSLPSSVSCVVGAGSPNISRSLRAECIKRQRMGGMNTYH